MVLPLRETEELPTALSHIIEEADVRVRYRART